MFEVSLFQIIGLIAVFLILLYIVIRCDQVIFLGKQTHLLLEKFKVFFYTHHNFLSAIFIIIYTIQQLCLVYFIFIWRRNPELISLGISIYVTIASATFGIDKLIMSAKMRKIEDEAQGVQRSLIQSQMEKQQLINAYEKLYYVTSAHIDGSRLVNTKNLKGRRKK